MSPIEANYGSSHFLHSMKQVERHAVILTARTKATPEAYYGSKAYVKV